MLDDIEDRYVTLAAGIETIAEELGVNDTAVVLDADGLPGVAYISVFGADRTDVRFATWDGVSWSISDVDSLPGSRPYSVYAAAAPAGTPPPMPGQPANRSPTRIKSRLRKSGPTTPSARVRTTTAGRKSICSDANNKRRDF